MGGMVFLFFSLLPPRFSIMPSHLLLCCNFNSVWLSRFGVDLEVPRGNDEITVLVNDAEKSSDIDPQEAQQTLEIAEAALRKAEGKRQTIKANLAL
ncbi:hypothetical protein L1987_11963 [Smallanthus sonchifolius]|uniref:Uncharacterized protein n=1 Tax=Smallanthus sonchifolius TaxID=185202 RepID=A0ACB9JCZ9_9ASTR|nr:hypothetical protein L1987_11963 [Smallanthus sonchifolius]